MATLKEMIEIKLSSVRNQYISFNLQEHGTFLEGSSYIVHWL